VKAGAPGNLTVNDVGPNSMELGWSKPRNDGGSPIKGKIVLTRTHLYIELKFIAICSEI